MLSEELPTVQGAMNVFIDLSRSDVDGADLQRIVDSWVRDDGLGSLAHEVTIIGRTTSVDWSHLAPRWKAKPSDSVIAQFNRVLAASAREMKPILVLCGPVRINSDALGLLQWQLSSDPLLGFAIPRVACASGCCVRRMAQMCGERTEWLPRRLLADISDREFVAETASPCLLIKPTIVTNFGPLDERFSSLQAAIVHFMASGRRCGFRTVLCNRAVVSLSGLACEGPAAPCGEALSSTDRVLLEQLVPDLGRSWLEYPAGAWERFERLYAAANVASPAARPSLLVDMRNLHAIYNGTSRALLGAVKGLEALQPRWDITLVAQEHAARFHRLSSAHPDREICHTFPDRPFTVAFRPAQPWDIGEMIDLHRAALFNVYLMLDVIACDITYIATPHLHACWEFAADHADAFVFESEFSRDRFLMRFPSARGVPSVVSYFPFDPSEYVPSETDAHLDDRRFFLIIGNDYDHKDVARTVEAVASAFPFQLIEVLGPVDREIAGVRAWKSGALPESTLHRLYRNADYVIFPSFYEGFAFPIVTALSYGKTVLARRSTLVDELAAHAPDRGGRLITFETREELVDLLGRFVHGEAVPCLPLGHAIRGTPRTWWHFAHDVMAFIEEIASDAGRSRWKERERAVRQLAAYRPV